MYKTLTMADIARRANISPMTVSRVINNSGPVKETTRKKVLDAINKFGYRKERSSVNGNKRILIDIDPSRVHDEFVSKMYFPFLRKLSGKNYTLQNIFLRDMDEPPVDMILHSDAIITWFLNDSKLLDKIRQLNPAIKTLTLCPRKSVSGVIEIDPDDNSGGEIAAKELFGKGHRHAVVLSSININNFLLRYESFKDTFVKLGGQVEHIDFEQGNRENLKNAVEKYFSGNFKASAVFSTNCRNTCLLFNILTGMGIKVPDDLSVIGYDNSSIYESLPVGISRIEFDLEHFGNTAALILESALNDTTDNISFNVLEPVKYIDYGSVLEV